MYGLLLSKRGGGNGTLFLWRQASSGDSNLIIRTNVSFSCSRQVYVPLDFESRYVVSNLSVCLLRTQDTRIRLELTTKLVLLHLQGKEIIGVFANRLGKSGMSLFLSTLTYAFGDFGLYPLSLLSTVASTTWLATSWWLSDLLPTKAEARDMVDNRWKKED